MPIISRYAANRRSLGVTGPLPKSREEIVAGPANRVRDNEAELGFVAELFTNFQN